MKGRNPDRQTDRQTDRLAKALLTTFRTAVTAALFLAASIFVPTEVKADTTVTASTTEWEAGTYVVTSDTTIETRVKVKGAAVLKINSGVTLTVPKGIAVVRTSSESVNGYWPMFQARLRSKGPARWSREQMRIAVIRASAMRKIFPIWATSQSMAGL